MEQHLLNILSLMIMTLAGIGLLGALALSFVSRYIFSPAEQSTTVSKAVKTMLAASLLCLAIGTAFWVLFSHFPADVAARWIAVSALILPSTAKTISHYVKRNNVPTP